MPFKTPEEKNLYAYRYEIVIRHVKGSISLSYFVRKLIANSYDSCFYKSGKQSQGCQIIYLRNGCNMLFYSIAIVCLH